TGPGGDCAKGRRPARPRDLRPEARRFEHPQAEDASNPEGRRAHDRIGLAGVDAVAPRTLRGSRLDPSRRTRSPPRKGRTPARIAAGVAGPPEPGGSALPCRRQAAAPTARTIP